MPETTTRRATRRPAAPATITCRSCGRADVAACRCPEGCGRCNECCACGAAHLTDADSPVRPRVGLRFSGEATAEYPRYVTAEVEFAGIGRHGGLIEPKLRALGCNVVSDASCGYEVPTAPARGEAVAKLMKKVMGILGAAKARLSRSCGTHVHVDTRDADGNLPSFATLRRMVLLYARVEPALFDVVAPSRHRNDTCKPNGAVFMRALTGGATTDAAAAVPVATALDEAETQARMERALYGVSGPAARTYKTEKYPGCRYGGLNLHSFFFTKNGSQRGTLEFRMHQGTLSSTKILGFMAVCSSVVEWAHQNDDDALARLRGSPAEILDKVCTSPAAKAWRKARAERFRGAHGRMTHTPVDTGPDELTEG